MKAHLTPISQREIEGTVLCPLSSAFLTAASLPELHILPSVGQTLTGFRGRLGIYLSAALTGGSDNYPASGFSPRTGHFHQNSCPADAVPEDCGGQALLMDPGRNQTSVGGVLQQGYWSQAGK